MNIFLLNIVVVPIFPYHLQKPLKRKEYQLGKELQRQNEKFKKK